MKILLYWFCHQGAALNVPKNTFMFSGLMVISYGGVVLAPENGRQGQASKNPNTPVVLPSCETWNHRAYRPKKTLLTQNHPPQIILLHVIITLLKIEDCSLGNAQFPLDIFLWLKMYNGYSSWLVDTRRSCWLGRIAKFVRPVGRGLG